MRLAFASMALAVSLAACGDGNGPPAQDPTQLAFQVQPSTGTAGQPITPAIQVVIEDASGALVATAADPVTLALGTNPSGAALGGTTTVDAVDGVATFSGIQISKPGTGYTLTATAATLTAATSAQFDVSPAHGVAMSIEAVAGDGQDATVGQPVAVNPSVKVTDGFGDPVAQVAVTFAVPPGSGSGTGLAQTTGADGVATVGQWTLGTAAGLNTLSAASAGLAGSPVIFSAIAVAGPAVAMAVNDGDDQEASPGTLVEVPPSVLVTDAFGNPVGGVGVAFAVNSGGGSVTGGSPVSGSDGVAAVGSWTLGPVLGPNSLEASSAGLDGSPVIFHATATAFPNVVVEVHNNYFLSLRNGSGADPGFFGSLAVDTVGVGGTVTWQWAGQGHNVTPYQHTAFVLSGNHDAPYTFGPVTFDTPGVYVYRCTIHSDVIDFFGLVGMRGQIVVR